MKKIIDIHKRINIITKNETPKVRKISPHLLYVSIFAIIMVVFVPFSLNITKAASAIPNQGHDWVELGNVLVSIIQGGTGLNSIGAPGETLVASSTGALEYRKLDKTDVGLPNVEDTALSTWPGTTNINTVGTITNGVWQGTKIDDAYINSAGAWNAKEPAIIAGAPTQYYRGDKTFQTLNTTAVPEGTRLYFTNARARSALSGVAPLVYNSVTGAFSIPKATNLANGYLSSGDWNTFNNKESAVIPATTAEYYRGDKTFQTLDTDVVPEGASNKYYNTSLFNADLATKTTTDLAEGANLYFTDGRADARITAQMGFANGLATLDGSSKIPLSQIPDSLIGGVNYQGAWDADVNTISSSSSTPALIDGIGNKGDYFVVAIAGATSLDGITDWAIGDWAIFNGSIWEKVENTDEVNSVNGYTGVIVLDKTDVGLSNVEDTALSTWLGTANINTVGTITNGVWNGTPIDDAYIASSATWNAKQDALSFSAPLVNVANTISILQADTSTDGYLSTGDWNTFNNKEPAIIPVTTAEYYRGDKTFQALDTSVVPENGNLYYTSARFDTDLSGKTTTNLAEGVNQYYTDVRARGALSGTAPIDYDNSTGVISLAPADTATNGYLSSADWNTFNTKEPAIATDLTSKYFRGDKTFVTIPFADLSGAVSVVQGGTGATTQTSGFDALSPITAKGDLISSDGANNVRLGVGTDGQVLTADSSVSTGVKWVSPYRNLVTLGSDVTNNNSTANTMQDCTGLSFDVTSGISYNFKTNIYYTSAVNTTGSRWSINGPATTNLTYSSHYSLTATTNTWGNLIAYNMPAISNITTPNAKGFASIEGFITPSVSGTVVIRFASEVANSAVICRAGSTLEWW